MKKLIPFLAIIMAGCVYPHYAQPVTTSQPSNNDEYKVSYLFEYGGCKVYRFYDGGYGNTVYFTNCGGDTVGFGDSTQVRSSGSLRYKQMDISAYMNEQPEKSFKYNPYNASSFVKTKDTGYYKNLYKPQEISSFKGSR